jgi:CPA2 family monovalent cation:H+ antiporter-2
VHQETPLIGTIAVGLAFAFFGGMIAHRLYLPPLVGYLLAGIAVGPFTPGFVADAELAQQLAEIGVILLMFGVGMHFSIRDLWQVRSVAVPGAIGQIAVATILGVGLSSCWGWSMSEGIVFGLALSVASTVVLLKGLEARGLLRTDDGKIAVGWLIVEDLVMVLALVLLPAAARLLGDSQGDHHASTPIWVDLATTLAKVGAFSLIMLVIGPRVFPRLLKAVESTRSRELFTLAVIALSMGVAYGSAEFFGVSFALGAFFAGVVLHESDLNDRASDILHPLQEMFAALFFVAVGMLFNPAVLVETPMKVLGVVAVIVLGKSLAAMLIVRGLGRSPQTARTAAASLAQIGEFSFILTAMGLQLGLLPPEGQSLIVAGALISITLNPLVFYWAVKERPASEAT